jgi:SSS family solute:Na+ symporter
MTSGVPLLHFAFADHAVLLLYGVAVLLIGFIAARRRKRGDVVDFLLAGRSLTTPLFVMTLVSTWYGGILGVGEFSYRYGLSNWVIQGVPYYLFAVVFAFLLAARVRRTNFATIPDKLEDAYDRRTALLGAGLTFLLMTPAPYVLMLGVLIQMVSGWGFVPSVLLGTFVTTVYLVTGGFRSDVYTDVLEFFLMFLGFGIILPYAVTQYGGWSFLVEHLPPRHLTWHGGASPQFIIVWFFIALWTLVDPSFHQRCYAARSGAVARNGILWSILFWVVFDAMTATAGLYARAVLPGLDQPVMAFPLLGETLLPPVAKGLFFVGMLATIMSSLNTLAFISGTTLGRDVFLKVLKRLRRGEGMSETFLVQSGLLISAGAAVVLAVAIPSVIKLWYAIGTVIVPGLLVPLVTSYFDRLRIPARGAFVAMLTGWLTSSVWLIAGWRDALGDTGGYPWGIEPMYPGLLVSVLVWGGSRIFFPRPSGS